MTAPVAVDVLDQVIQRIELLIEDAQTSASAEALGADLAKIHMVRYCMTSLADAANRLTLSIEAPGFAKQSNKNVNAGFVDWRSWCALLGEVHALRAALARVGGAQ